MIIVNLYNIKWKKKYNRKELSAALGMSPSTITKLTRGEHIDVTLSILDIFCDFFGCIVQVILVEVEDIKEI